MEFTEVITRRESIRKFDGKYYFIYSSMLSHELAYAVSDRPDGDFVYGGTLHSNGNIGIDGNEKTLCYWGNNHGSVERINGKYYIFGHRQTNYHEYSRQGVAEELRFENGKFYPAEMTSCGLNGGPLRDTGVYPAGIACVLMGKDGACKTNMVKNKAVHPCFTQEGPDSECDAGHYVKNITDGTVVGYKYFDFCTAQSIFVCVRGSGNGMLQVCHKPDGDAIGIIRLSGSTDWTEESVAITPQNGKQAIYFRYQGTGSIDMKQFELK